MCAVKIQLSRQKRKEKENEERGFTLCCIMDPLVGVERRKLALVPSAECMTAVCVQLNMSRMCER